MTNPLFKGAIPALVTPFLNGAVDEKAFVALVERQIAAGDLPLDEGNEGFLVHLPVAEWRDEGGNRALKQGVRHGQQAVIWAAGGCGGHFAGQYGAAGRAGNS